MAPTALIDKIIESGKKRSSTSDQDLSQDEKASISAHLGYLSLQTASATSKLVETQRRTIIWLLGQVPHALFPYLCCSSQLREIRKSASKKIDNKLCGTRLRTAFQGNYSLSFLSWRDWTWLRDEFDKLGSKYGFELDSDSARLGVWLESLCPPGVRQVMEALCSDARPVCAVMLAQVQANGLTNLQKLLPQEWGRLRPPELVRRGGGEIFASIDTMLPNEILGRQLEKARTSRPREASCLSVYQLRPATKYSMRVAPDKGLGFLVNMALLQCRNVQPREDQLLTVVVDAGLDGPMVQIPATLSSQLFLSWPRKCQNDQRKSDQEAEISPNLRPKLVITPSRSFTDAHIDMGSHGLAAIGPEVLKLWGLWPGTEKNVRTLGKLKREAAKRAKEATTWAEFVLADAVLQLEHGIWVTTEPLDLLHMPPGTIHAVYTISGGVLVGSNFVSADDVADSALAVDNYLE